MSSSTNLEQLKLAIKEEQKIVYPVHIRALIPIHNVGCVIGKKGEYIQYIQNYANVHMVFLGESDTNLCCRLLHIHGTPRACAKAINLSFQRIFQKSYETYSDNISIDLVLPNEFIQVLKTGYTVNQFTRIARESNTEIMIKPQFLPRSTERIVRVTIPNTTEIRRLERATQLVSELLGIHCGLALSAGNQFYLPLEEDVEELYDICNTNQDEEVFHL